MSYRYTYVYSNYILQEAEDESTGEWGGVEGLDVEEVPFTEIAQVCVYVCVCVCVCVCV